MSFIESPRFPDEISLASEGGPEFNTSVIQVKSGFSKSQINWDVDLRSWNVASGIKNQTDFYTLLEFFLVCRAMGHRFRYKDWSDYKSGRLNNAVTPLDQTLGTATAGQTQFQLIKKYILGGLTLIRTIKKPVSGTIRPSVNDTEETTGWTFDTTTGLITRSVGLSAGQVVKAGFEFDLPAIFGVNKLPTRFRHPEFLELDIPVNEVRLAA